MDLNPYHVAAGVDILDAHNYVLALGRIARDR